MSDFYFNDGRAVLPEGWEDKTVVALSFPAGAEQASASFTITRDVLRNKEVNLATYVDTHLQTAKSFPKFKLLRHGDVVLDDKPAEQVEFTWRTPDKVTVHQLQTILINKGVALIFTATTQEGKFEDHKKDLLLLLNSIRLRQDI
ncbi:MAG: hypothetical protein DRH26_06705 [Deltaproteobacteria bacterium]|nr:MAG: hypothetical protein DRH26_06705 [Deltaproteobacteria bacterium]